MEIKLRYDKDTDKLYLTEFLKNDDEQEYEALITGKANDDNGFDIVVDIVK